ncbi:hypothetical protein RGB72_10950 [Glutamicibacter protophormiae]|uniref:Uncharacterized protein n=1 Tax=Kocuria varians TaxID=1272 RepID=A0A7D7Q3N4_KOCVA|nr:MULTISPECIES: hypothetical protein [Kocuria]EHX1606341.1 hypothetical protein [Salmonella enterica subsp. enterica serovar Typhi]WNB88470.1 hypothetical protein RGB72_10950 [Glutamicibacter protophormiae]MDN5630306.1 hypothetical protein [Kocuria sp.]QMS55982.1 hypothetical protein CIB50_0000680 [Kocuria varians]RUP85282.1 hypothetical protein D8M39_00740 [Kocuria sp. HSID17590]
MSLFKSKAQKQAKAANKAAESKVVNAGDWLSSEIGELGEKLQHGVQAGASALASGVEATGPYVQDGLGRAQELGEDVKHRSDKAKAAGAAAAAPLAAKAAKKTAHGRAAAQEKYSGAVAALASKVADADTSDQFDALVAKLTGDKKTVKRIQKAAKNSAKEYAKQQKKAQGGHKGLLFLGLLVAGGVAGAAAWRASRPVQDPWKTPATASPRVSASPVNTNSTVAAGAGVKVDDVKDPSSPVHKEGTASQAAHRATDSVKSVAEDAKQTVNEVKEQIKGSGSDDTKLGSPDNNSKHDPKQGPKH